MAWYIPSWALVWKSVKYPIAKEFGVLFWMLNKKQFWTWWEMSQNKAINVLMKNINNGRKKLKESVIPSLKGRGGNCESPPHTNNLKLQYLKDPTIHSWFQF